MQPDPATLEALAGRVEAGEEGREIDVEILVATREWRWGDENEAWGYCGGKVLVHRRFGTVTHPDDCPPLLGSLDAIEALRERLLPGSLPPNVMGGVGTEKCEAFQYHRVSGVQRYDYGISDTERHARLAALLRAYAAKVRAGESEHG